jgi:hypothetical protein
MLRLLPPHHPTALAQDANTVTRLAPAYPEIWDTHIFAAVVNDTFNTPRGSDRRTLTSGFAPLPYIIGPAPSERALHPWDVMAASTVGSTSSTTGRSP